jgi:microcystin-dependent protein
MIDILVPYDADRAGYVCQNLRDFKAGFSLAARELFPVGEVTFFCGDSVPDGWLECDGSAVSRTTYADLFSEISTIYGSGDGATTFNLPDLRGRYLRSQDSGALVDPLSTSRTNRGDGVSGDEVGTIQAGDVRSHSHLFYGISEVLTASGGGERTVLESDLGSSGFSEVHPVSVTLLPIIRYERVQDGR